MSYHSEYETASRQLATEETYNSEAKCSEIPFGRRMCWLIFLDKTGGPKIV
jgi:hypothetical protein